MAEIEIRAERLEQYEQKAIEKQHNRRKNQMLNQGFSVSNFNFAWAAKTNVILITLFTIQK